MKQFAPQEKLAFWACQYNVNKNKIQKTPTRTRLRSRRTTSSSPPRRRVLGKTSSSCSEPTRSFNESSETRPAHPLLGLAGRTNFTYSLTTTTTATSSQDERKERERERCDLPQPAPPPPLSPPKETSEGWQSGYAEGGGKG